MIGLTDKADKAVETYSGGMKRRVNIGAGLLHKPDILFLDEPTVGVDPQSRNAIFENVEALNREGMTVIYTTHYMEEAQRLCHRVGIVDTGKMIALDTPSALIRSLGGGIVLLGVAEEQGEALLEQVTQLPAVKAATRTDGQIKIETDPGPGGADGRPRPGQPARHPPDLAGDPRAEPGKRLPAPDRQEAAAVGGEP